MIKLAFDHLERGLLETDWQSREIVRVQREGKELPRAPVAYLIPLESPGILERNPAKIRQAEGSIVQQLWVGSHGVRLTMQHTTPHTLEQRVNDLLGWLFDHPLTIPGLNGGQRVFEPRVSIGYFDDTGQYVGESGIILEFNAILLVSRARPTVTKTHELTEFEIVSTL